MKRITAHLISSLSIAALTLGALAALRGAWVQAGFPGSGLGEVSPLAPLPAGADRTLLVLASMLTTSSVTLALTRQRQLAG